MVADCFSFTPSLVENHKCLVSRKKLLAYWEMCKTRAEPLIDNNAIRPPIAPKATRDLFLRAIANIAIAISGTGRHPKRQ
jgi:hypothetical protein